MTKRSISDDRKPPFIWLHLEFDDLPLDPYAVRVYIHILRRAGRSKNGQCWESIEHIAKHCGMSVSSVKRALRTLIEAGLIIRVSRTGDTSLYSITDPEEWIIQPQVITEPALKQPGLSESQGKFSQNQGVVPTELGGGSEMAHKERSIEERSIEERSHSLESESFDSNNSTSQPESESEPSEPVESTIDKAEALSSQKLEEPKPIAKDSYSAAPFSPQKEIHSTERCDRRFKQEPWGFYDSPDSGFLEFLIKNRLRYVNPYKNYPRITRNHAKGWLKKSKWEEERYEEALIQWDAYQDDLKEIAATEEIRHTAEVIPLPLPVPTPVEDTRESLIARLRGKVKAGHVVQARSEAISKNIPLHLIGLSEGAAS